MAETMISSFDGTKLYLNRETEAGNRAIAVIVHGLCEHQGRYDYMAKCLHESGIGTYRFDHRGQDVYKRQLSSSTCAAILVIAAAFLMRTRFRINSVWSGLPVMWKLFRARSA